MSLITSSNIVILSLLWCKRVTISDSCTIVVLSLSFPTNEVVGTVPDILCCNVIMVKSMLFDVKYGCS